MKTLAKALILVTLSAAACNPIFAQGVTGTDPRPQGVTGTDPRPQGVTGTDPRPQDIWSDLPDGLGF